MAGFTRGAALAIGAAFLLDSAAALALSRQAVPLPKAEELDLDTPVREAMVDLDSPYMKSQVLAAMSMPYKYGVSQLPCRAKELQPKRGWHAAREPAGKIQWIPGPRVKVFWSGIYGTCLIQSPVARDKAKELERVTLECECNGWLPTNN